MAKLEIQLFTESHKSFVDTLDSQGIEYSRRIQLSDMPTTAGMTIEVISAIAQATPWGALAVAIIAWLHSKKSRKVSILKEDDTIIHLEGYSADEVERLIEKAKFITVEESSKEEE